MAGRLCALQEKLAARLRREPPPAGFAFWIGSQRAGTASPGAAKRLAALPHWRLVDGNLVLPAGPCTDALLNEAARILAAEGLTRGIRHELLDIRCGQAILARADRSLARALGITTLAARINGRVGEKIWLGQRSMRKTVGPGKWDNLAAGMAHAGETPLQAAQREAGEEAGLTGIALRDCGSFLVRRPVPEGHLIEIEWVFEAELPCGWRPQALDGEMQAFELAEPEAAMDRIEAGEMGIEAALSCLKSLADRHCA